MPISIAGRAPATFELKSAHLPLVCLLLKSTDLVALERELDERFADLPAFFDQDPLLIDLTPLPADAGAPDFPALVSLLRRHRVHPVAVRGGSEAHLQSALGAGLAAAHDAVTLPPRPPEAAVEPARPAPPAPPAAPTTALVVDRPLRAGQQVYARGRDLVVLSMVNPGAEVIADGNIHVYAPLRGKAIAGARGNADARIFTLCLEPQLISIAGVYRTLEEPLPPELLGRPAQVRLEGATQEGRLLMEALSA